MRIWGRDTCGVTRAAVIGAGSMGGGIAAQFANAGIIVDLLDIAGKGVDRDGPAKAGLARQIKLGGVMTPEIAANVRCGNIEDHLGRLAEADWIVEAVVEELAVKRDLFDRIEKVRVPGAIVSSNTSTIPRADIVAGLGTAFARDFVVTHFFNPPRHMPLLEIVSGPETAPLVDARVRAAARSLLGKTVVDCRDTPGFIANRIGCFWIAVAILEARRLNLDVETADAVNEALGVPRTGAFGLLDLIGIDLARPVWGSLMDALPPTDALHAFDLPGAALIQTLIESGRLGRKSGLGFYRVTPEGAKEALDLATGAYRPRKLERDFPANGKDLAALLSSDCKVGAYAFSVLSHVVAYAATHARELADDVAAIDTAIELGYSWKKGPFRLADAVGVDDLIARMRVASMTVPPLLMEGAREGFYSRRHVLGTDHTRRAVAIAAPLASAPLLGGNTAASLHDLGDGVACFRIHSKLNTLQAGVLDQLEATLERSGQDFAALVIGNEDPRAFSAGGDLTFLLGMADQGREAELEAYLAFGQRLFLSLRRAPIPVVAAAHGFALGGGCELMMHTRAVVAHAELAAGLPEASVGLLPGWGGCTSLLMRALQDQPDALLAARSALATILACQTSRSALDARKMGFLDQTDTIVMHRGDLLPAAKRMGLELQPSHVPRRPELITVVGPAGKADLLAPFSRERAEGRLGETDFAVAEVVADVLTGGSSALAGQPLTEEALMAEERAGVLRLLDLAPCRERMRHMVRTGKALRN